MILSNSAANACSIDVSMTNVGDTSLRRQCHGKEEQKSSCFAAIPKKDPLQLDVTGANNDIRKYYNDVRIFHYVGINTPKTIPENRPRTTSLTCNHPFRGICIMKENCACQRSSCKQTEGVKDNCDSPSISASS